MSLVNLQYPSLQEPLRDGKRYLTEILAALRDSREIISKEQALELVQNITKIGLDATQIANIRKLETSISAKRELPASLNVYLGSTTNSIGQATATRIRITTFADGKPWMEILYANFKTPLFVAATMQQNIYIQFPAEEPISDMIGPFPMLWSRVASEASRVYQYEKLPSTNMLRLQWRSQFGVVTNSIGFMGHYQCWKELK
jgi:hypothetical protein